MLKVNKSSIINCIAVSKAVFFLGVLAEDDQQEIHMVGFYTKWFPKNAFRRVIHCVLKLNMWNNIPYPASKVRIKIIMSL